MENIYLTQHQEVIGEFGVYRSQIPAGKRVVMAQMNTAFIVLHAMSLSIVYNPLHSNTVCRATVFTKGLSANLKKYHKHPPEDSVNPSQNSTRAM